MEGIINSYLSVPLLFFRETDIMKERFLEVFG